MIQCLNVCCLREADLEPQIGYHQPPNVSPTEALIFYILWLFGHLGKVAELRHLPTLNPGVRKHYHVTSLTRTHVGNNESLLSFSSSFLQSSFQILILPAI